MEDVDRLAVMATHPAETTVSADPERGRSPYPPPHQAGYSGAADHSRPESPRNGLDAFGPGNNHRKMAEKSHTLPEITSQQFCTLQPCPKRVETGGRKPLATHDRTGWQTGKNLPAAFARIPRNPALCRSSSPSHCGATLLAARTSSTCFNRTRQIGP